MKYQVVWTAEAIDSFEERIAYLTVHWTNKEIDNFKKRTIEYLNTLVESPLMGRKTGRLKNVYTGLIRKQVSIIYRVVDSNHTIEILSFLDNRQNPSKIKKYK